MRKVTMSFCVGLAVLTLSASTAWADLVIVSTVKMEGEMPAGPGGGDMPKPGTTVTRYKGTKTRVENGNTVTITDSASPKVITLDIKKKTYYTSEPLKDMEGAAGMAEQFMAMMDLKLDVDAKDTGEAKEILTKNAKKYTYSIKMKMGFKEGAALPFGGGAGGETPQLPTIVVSGESWNTEDVTIPVSKTNPKDMLGGMNQMLKMFEKTSPDLKEKMMKLGEMKGFPLRSAVTITFEGGAGLPGIPEKPMVIKTEVTQIKDVPLEDSLFAVPKGFKKVAAPAPPMGGFGG